MPISFRIVPDRGLLLVRFHGFVTTAEIKAASEAYVVEPRFAPGQRQLVDLSDITDYDIDYVAFMKLQADKAERLALAGVQSIVAYIAPTPVSQEVSALFVRTWADVDAVVPVVQPTREAALALLGEPEDSLADLLALAHGPALQ